MMSGRQLLTTRRSVRAYRNDPIDPAILSELFDLARVAPSARNRQPWTFTLVRSREKLARLASIRGDSSAPIGRAPMAVAITADPQITPLPVDDASIAAYHLMLAAWLSGLGTCWIGGMNLDEVKEILDIPKDHYVATVTPLGYPVETPPMGERETVRIREM